MNHAILARRATWDLFKDAAAATVGFASPLYRAALRARLGRDPAGDEFCVIAARLPAQDQDRLWKRVKEQRAEAGRAA